VSRVVDQVLIRPPVPPVPEAPARPEDERAAREDLREQIRRLERELSQALPDTRPGDVPAAAAPRRRGPRVLGLGDLEALRDDLADRLRVTRREVADRAEREAEKRVLLERMLRDPRAYKYVRVTSGVLGEPGCVSYHVKPRLGIIGMLAGWWHVKVSSGCPLAAAHARTF
jgi:hypothetical protein